MIAFRWLRTVFRFVRDMYTEREEFPPEAFAAPYRPARELPLIVVDPLHINPEGRYGFALHAPLRVLDDLSHLPAIESIEPLTYNLDYAWALLSRDYAIDAGTAHATYAALKRDLLARMETENQS